ncbi:Na(+)-translocating NADH-quinone reductase subunit C [Geovibrio thiophilus]|uniref:Na(+)-translocating NADH-quinone reductase subunit C n=1 Tax=Geovibrio thiophilus TaxID=139438 RepID=A0A3R5Y7K2_9BACT|nr:Na(+)-translocating NADH-quinone reductase subunit C [Geovibrio thiophilus]QAR33642.1 Na(+)-translocating NADH-quinone reductase subunit C [Geovibrio thiophilus]
MPDVNSRKFTFIVSLVLSVVCSVLVSAAAVSLKPIQDRNRELDRQKNVLAAAGLLGENTDIEEAFENISVLAVNVGDGSFERKQGFDTGFFKDFKALSTAVRLTKEQDTAGIASIAEEQPVYIVMRDGKPDKIILHVYGSGLWSTMYGFLALEGDGKTVAGLTFYDQKETPGLGGEVDNPNWKAQWRGKEIYGEDGGLRLGVGNGKVDPASPDAAYLVDSLSGASMTSRGVNSLVRFWLGENGYGKFLSKIEAEGING